MTEINGQERLDPARGTNEARRAPKRRPMAPVFENRRVSERAGEHLPGTGSGIAMPSRADRIQAVPVNCFTPGTRISTPRGDVAVEALKPGDLVVTRDNGPQEIRWIGQKALKGPPLRFDNRLQPVRIRAGALGPNLPDHDLRLSPGHRVLLLGDHRTLDVAEAEVFVSARHLVGTRGIAQDAVSEVRYLHFMCDRHEVVLSNGVWTESFQPSESALEGVAEPSREEIFELFPELRGPTVPGGFGAARTTAPAHAIKKLGS